ncbi:S-adenosyl-L-methionine-dependent methyltransferase [Chytriomyces sp. MP71]|nr:S-adenosyl-L-methionine-dependent methyltransferase [Chytriomyces sp. MP71]
MEAGWPGQMLAALAPLLSVSPEHSNGSATSAEKALRTALRACRTSIKNGQRKTLAQVFYGTLLLRGRLSFALDCVAIPSLPGPDPIEAGTGLTKDFNNFRVTALASVYVIHEHKKYFDHSNLDEEAIAEWLNFASNTIGQSAIACIYNWCPSSHSWPSDPVKYLSVFHSIPLWLANTIIASFPSLTVHRAFAESLNHPAPACFRANLYKCTSLTALHSRMIIPCTPTRFSPSGFRVLGGAKPEVRGDALHQAGLFEVQDEGSQMIALATGAKRGSVVVDLCCGRGGKSLHLADMMSVYGEETDAGSMLLCHDVDPGTLREAQRRMTRPGLFSEAVKVRYVCSESTEAISTMEGSKNLTGGRGGDVAFTSGKPSTETIDISAILNALGTLADIVLVDAPCSSLGTLRRGPNVRWEISPDSLTIFPPLQKSILEQAVHLVKPGGVLVYATCTFNGAECEGVRNWFDAAFGAKFAPSPLAGALGTGVMESLVPEDPGVSSVQLTPNEHGTDAFYITRWVRREQ